MSLCNKEAMTRTFLECYSNCTMSPVYRESMNLKNKSSVEEVPSSELIQANNRKGSFLFNFRILFQ